MKKLRLLKGGLLSVLMISTLFSCSRNTSTTVKKDEVSPGILKSISDLGFSTDHVIKQDDGYLVEGDLLLSDENLSETSNSPNVRIAETEQYRTTNVVSRLPRTVTVSVSNLPAVYSTATQGAVNRYNALNTRLRFQFVSSNGNIQITGFNQAPSGGLITLGYSGFPSSGNPYNQIKLNTNQSAYGANPNQGYVTGVIQHEMGHCKGFRHTDYFNRAFSCGGQAVNEGTSGIGATRIPGTPATADARSWMLACTNGSDRTFNSNDVVAVKYLYQ